MNDVIMCRQCGVRPVEEARKSYATPVCYACLLPPEPLHGEPRYDKGWNDAIEYMAAYAYRVGVRGENSDDPFQRGMFGAARIISNKIRAQHTGRTQRIEVGMRTPHDQNGEPK